MSQEGHSFQQVVAEAASAEHLVVVMLGSSSLVRHNLNVHQALHHGLPAASTSPHEGETQLRHAVSSSAVVTALIRQSSRCKITAHNPSTQARREADVVIAKLRPKTPLFQPFKFKHRTISSTRYRFFIDHYHRCRPHRSLDLTPPTGRPSAATRVGTPPIAVSRRDRLGGLIHEYESAA
jgi:hypothetical protein